ncbi:MAG: hypothetical protein HOW73_46280 [Polyangiaceae bacterium]|nr:hypothetical protein [Polyangiaceae bacterium]
MTHRWLTGLAALLFSSALTFSAEAQDKVTKLKSQYPLCTKEPSTADAEAARNTHKAALEAYDRKEYDKAARLWTEAYGFDCSRPKVFLNLGESFERAGKQCEALAMYELYLERAPGPHPDDIPSKIAGLRTQCAKQPSEKTETKMERPLGIAPWIILGSGGAIAVAGAVLVGVGVTQASDAADKCEDPENRTGCPTTAAEDGEAGETMSQVGQGLLYGGAGVAVLGIILQFAVNGERPVSQEAAGITVLPVATPDYAGLFVVGRFE